MSNKSIKILAIESSCDETSAAVLEVTGKLPGGYDELRKVTKSCPQPLVTKSNLSQPIVTILSNIVSSQVKLHAKYGGVYPELASREHIKNIMPVIEQALYFQIPNSKKQFPNKSQITNSKCQNKSEIQNTKYKILNTIYKNIDYIAVTTGPGLIGSLLVGVETAKTLAYVFNKPIIPVNHLEGHIYANFAGANQKSEIRKPKQTRNSNDKNSKRLENSNLENLKIVSSFDIRDSNLMPQFPLMALIVSGGHTSLIYMKNHLSYKIIGETLDDAAGEAFDKVAKLLDLPYPGGPQVETQAAKFSIFNFQFSNKSQIPNSKSQKNHKEANEAKKLMKLKFPRPMINSKDFNFSFSGLKTAVLYAIKKLPKPLSPKIKALICAEFQNAVVETLVAKTFRAAEKYQVKSILLGGGVAANSYLRKEFTLSSNVYRLTSNFFAPPKKLCTDNAAVIGAAAAYKILAGKISSWDKIQANANLEL